MGQVSPKISKELKSSENCNDRKKNIPKEEMKNKVEDEIKPGPMLLSPEKARDTATWIMTTW